MKVKEMKNKVLLVGLAALLLTGLAYSSREISASTTSPVVKATQNPDLDFTLVNATGYDIKELYISPTSKKDWDKSDEILKGKVFRNGTQIPITFHPKATAEKWDIMVAWTDGSENDEWDGLKLTEINKITLKYDKKTDKTSAIIE